MVHRKEQSQVDPCECSLILFLQKETKKEELEKLVPSRAGSVGRKRKILHVDKSGSVSVYWFGVCVVWMGTISESMFSLMGLFVCVCVYF